MTIKPEDTQRDRKALEIFGHAVEMADTEAFAGYLDDSCGPDTALRVRVEALLSNHIEDSFLQTPAAGPGPGVTAVTPVVEQPGDRVGRYKLLEKIGEGGCGIVYMAEQEEPVRRRVALKVIKPGMDTRQVIARFEAERQALAMMDHPNIAKVHDGGVVGANGTESEVRGQKSDVGPLSSELRTPISDPGRPYFVMELVRGIRITAYCTQHNLSTRERLDLFTAVCSAVQHAHQKGIIHRDLKPSNILVTELDGRPVPKVIDFGIAKATEQKLTDKTLFTQFAQFVGTPAYMSPEQAAMSGADIDTRSDIYSLGVLLYELLTGTTPFDAKDLLNAGFDEMRRIIRETEPQKPSTRLTQSARPPVAPSEVGGRRSEVGERKSALPSDLDWIVMKCLEKDRARRYETATGLAADIQRHLSSEPVTARPASAAYRFRKMVRRNKLAFAAGGAVIAALVIGVVVSTWQAVRATRAEHEARENAEATKTEAEKSRQVAKFLEDMLKSVRPSVALGRDATILREVLEKTAGTIGADLKDQPQVEAELRKVIGKVYDALGDYEKAAAMLDEAYRITKKLRGEEHKDVVFLLNARALVLRDQGKLDEAESMLREALDMDKRLAGEDGDVSTSLGNLGLVLEQRGKLAEAETLHREALALERKLKGDGDKDVAISLNNLAVVLQDQGKYGDSETALREALAIQRKLFGDAHPEMAATLNNLANAVAYQNRLPEAEALFRELVPIQRKLLGNAHPNVATGLNGLGLALLNQGRAADAEPFLEEAVEIERKARPGAHPQKATITGNLGRVMEGLSKFDEAEALFREALDILGKMPGPEHPYTGNWRNQLINLLASQEKWPELEAVMRDDLASARKAASGDGPHPAVAEALIYLASALRMQQKFPEAETLLLEAHEALQKKPAEHRKLLSTALAGLVSLYKAWGNEEKASEWQQKLAAFDNEQSGTAAGQEKEAPKSEPGRTTP